MKFTELCNQRCSVRDFKDVPVERKKLEEVLEAARLAPSAVNFQPWQFIVVRENENCKKVQECYHRDWFKSAPCYIIVCADHSQSWKRKTDNKDFADVDASIAAEHICLSAASLGLGTCWVCNFDPETLKENFSLPSEIEPLVIIPIGYPSNADYCKESSKTRKSITEIVKWEKY
ncbi:MAG: nitroreductase family protein [Bacteroidales bacterium]|nr:nitroreductase family protein [Bacteroidales bacterium]